MYSAVTESVNRKENYFTEVSRKEYQVQNLASGQATSGAAEQETLSAVCCMLR
jgi:hypothetical protein